MQTDNSSIGFESFVQTLETLRHNTLLAKEDELSQAKVYALSEKDYVSVTRHEEEDEIELQSLPHEKGHPFYLIKPEDLTPKFWYLENFTGDDFCFFKPDLLEKKLQDKGWNADVIDLCTTLIHESIGFCVDKKFTNPMGVAMMEIMYQAFDFLMWNKYATLDELHKFFRDMIVLYAVDDVPSSMRIFTPTECFTVAQYFAMQFDSVFLLCKAVVVPKFLVKIYVDN